MSEVSQVTIDAIRLVASLEAQRIAMAALSTAIKSGLVANMNYDISVNVEVKPQVIQLAPAGSKLTN